jgi:tRNA threonylcarbamoyladenosine biosynthesis protein TsaE
LRLVSLSAAQTQALGQRLGTALREAAIPAPLLLLRGDFGTGKTTFVQGLARGLGCTTAARSPSYLLVKVHMGVTRRLVHADLYRVAGPAAIAELAIPELAGPQGIIAVEWPGAAQSVLEGEARPVVELAFELSQSAVDGVRKVGRPVETFAESDFACDLCLAPPDFAISLCVQCADPGLREVLDAALAG